MASTHSQRNNEVHKPTVEKILRDVKYQLSHFRGITIGEALDRNTVAREGVNYSAALAYCVDAQWQLSQTRARDSRVTATEVLNRAIELVLNY